MFHRSRSSSSSRTTVPPTAQVAAAQQVLDELGVDDVAIVGLAKRLEEVWVPGDDHPVILARNSEALYLLQRLRDESHRFANTFHRERRSKSMTRSALDGIPGLGEARRKALLARFGSVKRVRAATAGSRARDCDPRSERAQPFCARRCSSDSHRIAMTIGSCTPRSGGIAAVQAPRPRRHRRRGGRSGHTSR